MLMERNMTAITTYSHLEDFGRTRLSTHFFMRDFLHSEIAAWHGLRNVPEDPVRAVYVGSQLCNQLLEPLQASFGRIHIRSGYRSPAVNDFGNKNRLNCASNESNYAAHIWDRADANGKFGATACIVIPWLVDRIARGGNWTDMAWWIHDHLPYSRLYFFTQLAAFNINWHEALVRRVDSYAAPKGCLIPPGTEGRPGLHAQHYRGFPALQIAPSAAPSCTAPARPAITFPARTPPAATTATPQAAAAGGQQPVAPTPPVVTKVAATAPSAGAAGSGKVHYRAIHAKTKWRAVNNHQSLEAAIRGPNGAKALFQGKVRINYQTHGDPLYVLVWQDGASTGLLLGRPVQASGPMRMAEVPVARLQAFERQSMASEAELEQLLG